MKTWIEKRQGKLWFALLINIIILITLMIIYKPLYETNDDMGIISLVNGMKGVYDTHLVFINRLIGFLLAFLYKINANIIWYALLQYLLLYLAFVSVTYVFLNKFKDCSIIPIVILFVYFFAYEGYIHLQFTKTAGIVSIAGGTLLFWALFQKDIHKPSFVCGWLLALLGSFYRIDQFWCEIALLTGLGVFFLFNLKQFDKKVRIQRLCICLLSFGILAGTAFGAHKIDRYIYDLSDEWNYYMDYQLARAELLDHGFPDYETNKEAYEAVGIDKITYKLFDGWTHQDPEKITVDIMESIVTLKKGKTIDSSFFISYMKEMAKGVWTITSFGFCLLLGILWLFRGDRSVGAVVALMYEMGIVALLYLYLFYQDRYLRNRVDVGIWMAVAIMLIWILDTGKEVIPAMMTIATLVIVVAFTSYRWRDDWRINQRDVEESFQQEKMVVEEIAEDKEHLYLSKAFTISHAKAYGIFESIPVGVADNVFPLGGWTAQSEPYMNVLEKYGVDNPFRDVINNDKIYLIDRDIDSTMEYINTWYDENAEAVYQRNIGKHSVYKIVSE